MSSLFLNSKSNQLFLCPTSAKPLPVERRGVWRFLNVAAAPKIEILHLAQLRAGNQRGDLATHERFASCAPQGEGRGAGAEKKIKKQTNGEIISGSVFFFAS